MKTVKLENIRFGILIEILSVNNRNVCSNTRSRKTENEKSLYVSADPSEICTVSMYKLLFTPIHQFLISLRILGDSSPHRPNFSGRPD